MGALDSVILQAPYENVIIGLRAIKTVRVTQSHEIRYVPSGAVRYRVQCSVACHLIKVHFLGYARGLHRNNLPLNYV